MVSFFVALETIYPIVPLGMVEIIYLQYLSETTLAKKTKAKNQQCSQCKKWFKRLETHTRCSAQYKQVSFNFNVSPLSSIPLVDPHSAALHGHNIQLHHHNIQLQGHNIQLHQKSNCCSPYSDFLNPFNCPTSAEEWARAYQEMARSVVPTVLAATSVEEKNQLLCNGIYNFFSSSYGTRAKGKQRTIKKSKQYNRSLHKSVSKIKDEYDTKECAKHFNRFAEKFLMEMITF